MGPFQVISGNSGRFSAISDNFQPVLINKRKTGDCTPKVLVRERNMRKNFFCTNFLNTPRGLGHPGKIPATSQIPLFETGDIPDSSVRNPRKTNFRGRARTFRPPPLRVDDPHPNVWSPDPKKLIFVLCMFSCLSLCGFMRKSAFPKRFVFLRQRRALAKISENLHLGSVYPLTLRAPKLKKFRIALRD